MVLCDISGVGGVNDEIVITAEEVYDKHRCTELMESSGSPLAHGTFANDKVSAAWRSVQNSSVAPPADPVHYMIYAVCAPSKRSKCRRVASC